LNLYIVCDPECQCSLPSCEFLCDFPEQMSKFAGEWHGSHPALIDALMSLSRVSRVTYKPCPDGIRAWNSIKVEYDSGYTEFAPPLN
ncbi:MAG: hypothetical protein FWD35_06765, partial [Oscillospiraceae bacterium]|nr:hypothetical protein [Oscillospiraceae bacterium]